MFTKFVEKLSEITLPILDHGWIVFIPLGILYFIFPNIFDSLIVRLIIIIPIALTLLMFALGIALGVGQFIFKKYAEEYDRLVNEGEDKSIAFAKTSLKAITIFIVLFLLAFLLIFKNLFYEPNIV